MAKTLVGALRVTLGLDSAEFAAGASRVQTLSQNMAKKLALIGGTVSVVGAGLAAAIRGAINSADDMGELAQKLGVPVESLSALKYAAEKSGVGFEELQGSLLKLNRGMTDSPEKFEKLGIAVRDAQGEMRPTVDVLKDIADRFRAMPDGAEKSALAMDLFGKAGAAMILALNGGGDGLQQLMDRAKELGLVISQDTADAAGRFNDNLYELGAVAAGIATILAAQLAPVLESISAWLVEVSAAFQNLSPAAQEFIAWGAGLAVILGPLLLALSAMAPAIGLLLSPLALLTPAIAAVGAAIGLLLSPIGLTIGAIALLAAGLYTLLPTMEQWHKFWSDIGIIVDYVGTKIGEFISAKIEGLKTAFNDLQTNATTVWEGIKTSISGAIDWVTQKWDTFVAKLEGAIQVARDVGTAISEALSLGDGTAVGESITSGLTNGILGGRNGVVSAAMSLGLSAGQALRDSLETNSPSKVTERIGVNAAEGLALGMGKGGALVDQAARGLGDTAAGAMKGIGDLGSRIGDMFATAATNVLTGVESLREAAGKLISQISQLLINSAMKSLFGNIFDGIGLGGLPGYASGTMNAAAGWAMVGEQGPELVRMRGGERVYDARQTDRLAAGGGEGAGPTQIRNMVYLDGTLILDKLDTVEGEMALRGPLRKMGVGG